MTTLHTAVFDTKPYDRKSLRREAANGDVEWRFMDWRLSADTAASAQGVRAVCIFVNDRVDRACLEALASQGVRHVALRCAGYNSIDIEAATELGLSSRASRSTHLTQSRSMQSPCSSRSIVRFHARATAFTT